MTRRFVPHQSIRAVCLWLAIVAAGPSAYGQPQAPPSWTVEDQIRIARVSGEMDDQLGPPFRYSPTGDLVAFVTVASDLATDLTEARLRVWQVRAIQRFAQGADGDTPAPVLDFAVRSSANRVGISDVKWTADGAALLFLVQEREGANALYRWVARPALAPEHIATLDSVISGYDMLAQGRVVLYSDPAPVGTPAYVPELANGRPLQALINEVWAYPPQLRPQRLHVLQLNDSVVREIDGYIVPALGTFPSPDGNYVIAADVFDADWNGKCWIPRYHPTPVARRQGVDPHQLRYVIIDVRRRTTEPATGGPSGFLSKASSATTVHWASDSTRAIIPFAFTANDRCGSETGKATPGVYELSIEGRELQLVYPISTEGAAPSVREIRWDANQETIALTMGDTSSPAIRILAKRDGRWQVVPSAGKQPNTSALAGKADVRVLAIRESLNLPPAVYALASNGRERLLHDLAPHARGVTFGPVEPFTWQDSAGRTWEAILAYPFDYREGQRYPLIVQTHGFARGAFFAEGVPTTTAFPGRAATARGLMVLTIDENREAAKSDVITHEAANVLDGYQSAIAKLDRQGLIDRARVGIIGWSRTSYHVKYAITMAPDLFAAAVGADGIDFGYGNYLAGVDLPYLDGPRVWEQLYRAAPYGQWAQWSEAAPAFNVHRVKAPFRGEANSGRESLLSEWEFYAGLRRLNKPTELWVYPRGQHTLRRPTERRTSQEGSLDWLDYWLNNRRDPNPAKRDQYERWDAMRAAKDGRLP